MNNNIDIYEQLNKIICKFLHNKNKQEKLTEDQFEDLRTIAIFYFIDNDLLSKFDKNRSKFSYYVYYIMERHYPIFLYQIKYNLSFNEARLLYRNYCKSNLNKVNEQLAIINPITIVNEYNKEDESIDPTVISDSSLKDESVDSNVERQVEFKILLEDCIKAINKSKVIKNKNKDMLIDLVMSCCNVSGIAKKYGVSRQHVYNELMKLRRVLKRRGINIRY